MVTLHFAALWTIAPHAGEDVREAFDLWRDVVIRFDLERPQRASHFLAQILHESAGLTRIEESLNYTAPRICQVWPHRFPTIESALPYERNPKALANKVYGGRMGNEAPDDGWLFRGRGLLQITGRAMYQAVGDILRIDLVSNPTLVADPPFALMAAGAVWELKGCNALADRDDVRAVTKAINGGYVGIADRKAWLEKVRTVIGVLA